MKLMQDAKPEHAFYCADGSVLKNLRELAEKLKGISHEAYRHHANEPRNDFHNWIRDVYGNEKLAKKISAAKSSAEAAAIIEKALAPKQQKGKPAKREKSAIVKRKPARRRRKPSKQAKKAAAAPASAKKKGKKKPALEKAKKRRKTKRRHAKRKIMLHKVVRRHLKRIARQLGLL